MVFLMDNKVEYIKEYNKLVKKFKRNNINVDDFETIFKFLDKFTIDLIKNHLKYKMFSYCIEILYNVGKSEYF